MIKTSSKFNKRMNQPIETVVSAWVAKYEDGSRKITFTNREGLTFDIKLDAESALSLMDHMAPSNRTV